MNSRFIPCYAIGVPNGKPPSDPPPITSKTPIYSTYTNKLICYGPIPWGTVCDAPPGHKNYGKCWHVIEYIEANGTYMAHDREASTVRYVASAGDEVSSTNSNTKLYSTKELSNLANGRTSTYSSSSINSKFVPARARPNSFWSGRSDGVAYKPDGSLAHQSTVWPTNTTWNGNPVHTSTGVYYSSPYYQSTETYVQRYDNPVRNSVNYNSGNAWQNLSAYVYDITHMS